MGWVALTDLISSSDHELCIRREKADNGTSKPKQKYKFASLFCNRQHQCIPSNPSSISPFSLVTIYPCSISYERLALLPLEAIDLRDFGVNGVNGELASCIIRF